MFTHVLDFVNTLEPHVSQIIAYIMPAKEDEGNFEFEECMLMVRKVKKSTSIIREKLWSFGKTE